MCGAKEGDYFTLEGEMLYLPPGRGISIYSLGSYMFHLLAYKTDELTCILILQVLCSLCSPRSSA